MNLIIALCFVLIFALAESITPIKLRAHFDGYTANPFVLSSTHAKSSPEHESESECESGLGCFYQNQYGPYRQVSFGGYKTPPSISFSNYNGVQPYNYHRGLAGMPMTPQ